MQKSHASLSRARLGVADEDDGPGLQLRAVLVDVVAPDREVDRGAGLVAQGHLPATERGKAADSVKHTFSDATR